MFQLLGDNIAIDEFNTFKDVIQGLVEIIRKYDDQVTKKEIYWQKEDGYWLIDVNIPYPLPKTYKIVKVSTEE